MAIDHIALFVEGMSCNQCESTIKKAIGALNGVENVIVDLDVKKVLVEFEAEKVSVDIIRGIIEDQGYIVK